MPAQGPAEGSTGGSWSASSGTFGSGSRRGESEEEEKEEEFFFLVKPMFDSF